LAFGRSRRGSASGVAAVIFGVMVAATAISGVIIYYTRSGSSPGVGAGSPEGGALTGGLSNPALTNLTSAFAGLSTSLSGPALANLTSALGELIGALSNSTLANLTVAIGGPISVTDAALPAEDFSAAGAASTFTCGSAPGTADLALGDNGTSSSSVSSVTIASLDGVESYTPSGACDVAAGSAATYIVFPASSRMSPSPLAGQVYAGVVSLSDGTQVPFEGVWQ
jgi:hypothetical protein